MSEALSASPPAFPSAERPDLRRGDWTRLGDERVLGDEATETVLGRLAERTRAAARAQGYAVGWAEGHQAALRRASEDASVAAERAARRERAREQEHADAVTALIRAGAALASAARDLAADIGEQATDLAFEVTRALLGHELSIAADPGPGVVARVLAVLPADPTTVVRLHPRAAGSAAADELAEHGVTIVPDLSLAPDDAIVETDTTAIDLRIDEALGRLREALS